MTEPHAFGATLAVLLGMVISTGEGWYILTLALSILLLTIAEKLYMGDWPDDADSPKQR